MVKLNLLYLFAAFILFSTIALADDTSTADPPIDEPSAAEPPLYYDRADSPIAESPNFDYVASHDSCFKRLLNEKCAISVVYSLEEDPDLLSGQMPPDPTPECCQAVINIDREAPHCWNEFVKLLDSDIEQKYGLVEYCADVVSSQ